MRNVLFGAALATLLVCSACGGGPPPDLPGFAYVESGKFKMGYDQGRPNGEKPMREVECDHGFYIGKYEVTNEEYTAFCKATNHPTPPNWKDGKFEPGKEKFPVAMVSWSDARQYCEWKGGVLGGGAGRLPSEVEWEYAARGKDGRLYPWGNDWVNGKANNFEAAQNGPAPVGKFKDSKGPFETYDQAGNVWEWTNTAGEAPNTYVIKGGSSAAGVDRPRASIRAMITRDQMKDQVGFRMAKEP
jgi:serine/threonine-protein kinase